jgi:beta-lactam-binding protein with PASTA domain
MPAEVVAGSSMPDLRGRSAREAATLAARRGLIVELKGSGRVVSQSPEPGAEIEAGMTCSLRLSRGAPPEESVGLP